MAHVSAVKYRVYAAKETGPKSFSANPKKQLLKKLLLVVRVLIIWKEGQKDTGVCFWTRPCGHIQAHRRETAATGTKIRFNTGIKTKASVLFIARARGTFSKVGCSHQGHLHHYWTTCSQDSKCRSWWVAAGYRLPAGSTVHGVILMSSCVYMLHNNLPIFQLIDQISW